MDIVALDLKTSPGKYPLATGGGEFGPVAESLNLIKRRAPQYILRTTLVPGVVDLEDMKELASLARGAAEYHLQPFRSRVTLDPQYETLRPYSPNVMEEMAGVLEGVVGRVVRLW